MTFNRHAFFIALLSSALLVGCSDSKADADHDKHAAKADTSQPTPKTVPMAKLTPAKTKAQPMAKLQPAHHAKAIMIALYKKPTPDADKTMININTPFVPIIHKGQWVKVGSRRTGQVGWIHMPDYRKAWEKFTQPMAPEVSTLYVTKEGKGSDAKIIAYRDGKKLGPKEAKKLYAKMHRQEIKAGHRFDRQMHDFERMQARMQRQMQRQMRQMNQQVVELQQDFDDNNQGN